MTPRLATDDARFAERASSQQIGDIRFRGGSTDALRNWKGCRRLRSDNDDSAVARCAVAVSYRASQLGFVLLVLAITRPLIGTMRRKRSVANECSGMGV